MQNFAKLAGYVVVPLLAMAGTAFAQESQNASPDAAIPSLTFFTLGAVLVLAIGGFLYFLRKRSNRDAAERGLGIDDTAGRKPRH